jgi:hypothetical protein
MYDLRCELSLAERGERGSRPDQLEQMRRRAAELEQLVGADLSAMLASEDT